jgi:hypothetical protein
MNTDGKPAERRIEIQLPEGFLLFAIKTCLVAFVIAVATFATASLIIERVENSVAYTASNLMGDKIGGRQFWINLERTLDRAADPAADLPPEEKQKLLHDLHVIVARWQPFLDVLKGGDEKPAKEGQ